MRNAPSLNSRGVNAADGVEVGGVEVLGDEVRAEARDGVEDGPDNAVGLLRRTVGRGLQRVVPEVGLGAVGGVARSRTYDERAGEEGQVKKKKLG